MDIILDKTANATLFQYDDYRDFLKDRYLELKSQNSKFSYRYLAKKIDSTDNYFKNIFDKKRNVGLDRVSKIATLFKLNPIETQLLIFHVLYFSITDLTLKNFYKQQIDSYRLRRDWFDNCQTNDYHNNNSHKITADWLRGTIMEMFRLEHFQADANWIKNFLIDSDKYSIEQISEALKSVLDSGIVQNINGKWVVDAHNYVSPDYTAEEHQTNQNLLKKAGEYWAFPNAYEPQGGALGTIAVHSSDVESVMAAFLELTNKIVAITEKTKNPNTLMSFCSFAYSLTKPTADTVACIEPNKHKSEVSSLHQ